MRTLAIVSEGITDQAVIELIVERHFDDLEEEVEINALQPTRDATDESRAESYGGWEKVLELCSSEDRVAEALVLNDFLVVQIDTDQGDHVNFGLGLLDGGNEKSASQLLSECIELLQNKMGTTIIEKYGDRIMYAICVHSIECWMLALIDTTSDNRTKSCEQHFHRKLSKQDATIEKNYSYYRKYSKSFNRKEYDAAAERCVSLDAFIACLRQTVLTPVSSMSPDGVV